MAVLNNLKKTLQKHDHGQSGTRVEIFYGNINGTDATFTVPTGMLFGAIHASVLAVNGGALDETFQITGTVNTTAEGAAFIKPSSGSFTFTRTGTVKTSGLAVVVRIEGR